MSLKHQCVLLSSVKFLVCVTPRQPYKIAFKTCIWSERVPSFLTMTILSSSHTCCTVQAAVSLCNLGDWLGISHSLVVCPPGRCVYPCVPMYTHAGALLCHKINIGWYGGYLIISFYSKSRLVPLNSKAFQCGLSTWNSGQYRNKQCHGMIGFSWVS